MTADADGMARAHVNIASGDIDQNDLRRKLPTLSDGRALGRDDILAFASQHPVHAPLYVAAEDQWRPLSDENETGLS